MEYEYDYYASIVTAPDNLFFFADIDFDGVKELITGITPFGSSQRNCSAFTTIYKLVDGKYKDVSESFATKCEAFKAIEPYYFSVNYARKEIIQYHDGGAMSGGWKVYTFAKRKYRYDRYVHYDFDDDGDMVTVTVDYSDKRPKKSMRMSSADFWAKKYTL